MPSGSPPEFENQMWSSYYILEKEREDEERIGFDSWDSILLRLAGLAISKVLLFSSLPQPIQRLELSFVKVLINLLAVRERSFE